MGLGMLGVGNEHGVVLLALGLGSGSGLLMLNCLLLSWELCVMMTLGH